MKNNQKTSDIFSFIDMAINPSAKDLNLDKNQRQTLQENYRFYDDAKKQPPIIIRLNDK
jgi:hypothetical protein